MATDLAGWFARWLLSQKLTFSSTTITISQQKQPRPVGPQISAFILGAIPLTPLIVLPILTGDWWGLANSVSMLVSVGVRYIILSQNRKALDKAIKKTSQSSNELVKVFLTLSNGKAVTIVTSRDIVTNCLLTTPRPPNSTVYASGRAVGWLVFGVHVISLGMSTLFIQLLSVCLLLTATALVLWQVGDDDSRVGSRMLLEVSHAEGRDSRSAAYARLHLTKQEEDAMVCWSMFPQRWNEGWWKKYRDILVDGTVKRFESGNEVVDVPHQQADLPSERRL